MWFEYILFYLIYMYNIECIYVKGLNVIVLLSEEVLLNYVIYYQIEMNFVMDRVILQV